MYHAYRRFNPETFAFISSPGLANTTESNVRPQTTNAAHKKVPSRYREGGPRSTLRRLKRDDHPGSTRPHNETEKSGGWNRLHRSSTTVTGSRRECFKRKRALTWCVGFGRGQARQSSGGRTCCIFLLVVVDEGEPGLKFEGLGEGARMEESVPTNAHSDQSFGHLALIDSSPPLGVVFPRVDSVTLVAGWTQGEAWYRRRAVGFASEDPCGP